MPIAKSPERALILPAVVLSFLNSCIAPSDVVLFKIRTLSPATVPVISPLGANLEPTTLTPVLVLPHKKLPEVSSLAFSLPPMKNPKSLIVPVPLIVDLILAKEPLKSNDIAEVFAESVSITLVAPRTVSLSDMLVVPIPTLPAFVTARWLLPVLEPTLKP